MEINKIAFENLRQIGISQSFEDLDVNNDGKINEADENLATNLDIKNAISQILAYDVDEEPELLKNTVSQKASSSTSVRQNSQLGIPMTDVNTFENDVLKSKGTTYVCAGNGYDMAVKPIAANLPDIQKLANVYHLENVNTDIMNSLDSQLATILGRNGALMGGSSFYILKFVDGKLVDVFLDSPLPCGKNIVDILKEEAVGTPSSMPDIPEINKGINANKNKYGIYETNTKNFNNDVLSSKGTVYVTIGNSSCCYCKDLAEEISRNKQTLDPLCTIYSLSTDTDKELCWQIAQDWGGLSFPDGMPLPQIAKFVDGKFVQIMPVKTVSSMIQLAQGTCEKDMDGISRTNAKSFNKDVTQSKGTTYVMITSSSGCKHCNRLHYHIKNNLATLLDKFGFYELDIDTNKALGWQIAQDWGGGKFPDGMPLPQIAKFVDGKFVELLTNTRDYGNGLENAVIKEMLEKAEGTPINTSNTSGSSNDAKQNVNNNQNAEQKKEQEKLLKEQQEAQNVFDENKKKFEKEQKLLADYLEDFDNYQQEIENLNREILKEQEREEQEFQNEMKKAINNAINDYDPKTDGDDFDAYFARKMDDVGLPVFTKLNSLNWKAKNLSDNANNLLKNITTQSSVVNSSKKSLETATKTLESINKKLDVKIDNSAKTSSAKILSSDLTSAVVNAKVPTVKEESVDFSFIKDKLENDADIPDDIFNEIIEVEDEM